LVVYPGLNIRGTCENQSCLGYHKGVWVKKEYGQMSLGHIRAKNNCPACKEPMQSSSFKTLGYRCAKVEFEGVKIVNGIDVDFNFKDE